MSFSITNIYIILFWQCTLLSKILSLSDIVLHHCQLLGNSNPYRNTTINEFTTILQQRVFNMVTWTEWGMVQLQTSPRRHESSKISRQFSTMHCNQGTIQNDAGSILPNDLSKIREMMGIEFPASNLITGRRNKYSSCSRSLEDVELHQWESLLRSCLEF